MLKVHFPFFCFLQGGYTCLRYVDPESLRHGSFEPVDGATGRACRGRHANDNSQVGRFSARARRGGEQDGGGHGWSRMWNHFL